MRNPYASLGKLESSMICQFVLNMWFLLCLGTHGAAEEGLVTRVMMTREAGGDQCRSQERASRGRRGLGMRRAPTAQSPVSAQLGQSVGGWLTGADCLMGGGCPVRPRAPTTAARGLLDGGGMMRG